MKNIRLLLKLVLLCHLLLLISCHDGDKLHGNVTDNPASDLNEANNSPPVKITDDITGTPIVNIAEGEVYTFKPTVSGFDGGELVFSFKNLPRWASFSYETGALTGTPGFDDAGLYSNISIQVSDGKQTAKLAPFDIMVISTNRPPVLQVSAILEINEGDAANIAAIFSDPDGDQLIVTYSGWITENNYLTNYDDAGQHRVTVTVSDGELTVSKELTVIVHEKAIVEPIEADNTNEEGNTPPINNHMPQITGTPLVSIAEGEVYDFMPVANDLDGDALVFSIMNRPRWAVFSSTTGALTGTPGFNDSGVYENISIQVSDSQSTVELAPFNVVVSATNRPPMLAIPTTIEVYEGEPVNIGAVFSDPDEDQLTISYSGWLTENNYLTKRDDAGQHRVMVTVSDGDLTVSKELTVVVRKKDITGPVIVDVQLIDITETTAKIRWLTNEPAESMVEYGESEDYDLSVTSTGQTSEHVFDITNLKADTAYHYRLYSADMSGNETLTADALFTTLAAPASPGDDEPSETPWISPLGIPEPVWGELHPINTQSPSPPITWPQAVSQGYYFIDNSHAEATDTNNPYGFPDKPRASLPREFSAGAYVVINGGTYTENIRLRFNCSEQKPCWLVGNKQQPPVITGRWQVIDSSYLLMEYLDFNGGSSGALNIGATSGARTHHISLRHISVRNRDFISNSSGVGIYPGNAAKVHDIVIYAFRAENLGTNVDWSTGDPDFHAIAPSVYGRDASSGAELYNVWVLDSYFDRIGGNSVQVTGQACSNGPCHDLIHHIYIGRNESHNNRQASFGVKESSNVIISQNQISGGVAYALQGGDGIGYQYGPDNLWIIFNDISNNNFGIRQSSTDSYPDHNVYIVGNIIRDNDTNLSELTHWGSPSGWGVSLWQGNLTRYIVDNTFHNVRGGIEAIFAGSLIIKNNIFSNINEGVEHIRITRSDMAAVATIDHNLFYSQDGSNIPLRLSSSTTLQAMQEQGQCLNCIVGAPEFYDSGNDDFRLQANSQAINAGDVVDVYQTFYELYHLDIGLDKLGVSFPEGQQRDIGALVYTGERPDLIVDNEPPTVPTGLSGEGISLSEVSLGWNAASDNVRLEGYKVFRNGGEVITTAATSFVDLGLQASTAYQYQILAYDAAGNSSALSAALSVSTHNEDINDPPVLSAMSTIEVSEGEVVRLTPQATDPDGDELSFSYSGWMNSSSYTTNYTDAGQYRVTITVSDGALTDTQAVNIVVHDIDTEPPNLSLGGPTGSLAAGTVSAELTITTDEDASCRYSNNRGINFELMAYNFSTTGGVLHTSVINSLSEGSGYSYYVRCQDVSGNTTAEDFTITFTIESAADVLAPIISNGYPNNNLPSGTHTLTLSVDTNENAICKYDTNPNQDFDNAMLEFSGTGGQEHTTVVTSLINGSTYHYYVRCKDENDNLNLSDYRISFNVLDDVAQGIPWSYVGIPYTDWVYNPFTIQPSRPDAWPSAPAENYYYVEPGHPQATDTITTGELTTTYGRYGYPDRPRRSIPSNGWIGNVYTAGTVIWLKGGTHNGNPNLGATNFHSNWRPQFHGSAEQPIWIYGDPSDRPVFTGVTLQMFNSSHTIIDGLQWVGGNTSNGVLSLTVSDRPGPTHHITLRNLLFENLNYWGGGGAIIGIGATSREGGNVHDIVSYNVTFKNNGGGYDWMSRDNDHHGYKINGLLGGNAAYRIWIIDNQAIAGDEPDPVDNVYKSLSGNLVQVGDQAATSGNNHHVYVAGNYQEHARQALGWTKKSSDVIFSTNECTDTFNGAGGNGQCYGHQYGLGDYNWWINNIARNSASGWMHTANDTMTGPLFIVGNLFYNNTYSDRNDNWRTCSGATLFTQRGEHYFVNNLFDGQCHGIWARTNRHGSVDKLHIYNNIFSNFSANVDTTSKAISLENSRGLEIYMENNLFGGYSNDVALNNTTFSTVTELNSQDWASNNLSADLIYVDETNADYRIANSSVAIDAGTQTYSSGAPDVYQQFINRYSGDINYPGDPADYWPKDYLNQPRASNGVIDIGPYEKP